MNVDETCVVMGEMCERECVFETVDVLKTTKPTISPDDVEYRSQFQGYG